MSLERLVCASFDADPLEMLGKRLVRLWEKKRGIEELRTRKIRVRNTVFSVWK